MANTKNVGVNLTKEEMKEAFNQFIDLMYEAKGNSNVKVPERLVKTMPMIREEQLQAEHEASLYEEPFESGAGNLIYHIDLVKGKQMIKEVKDKKELLAKHLQHDGFTKLKGTVNSEYPDGTGNKHTYRTTKSKIGIMSEFQRKKIKAALETINIDLDTIRATPEQVAASKAEKSKKAA